MSDKPTKTQTSMRIEILEKMQLLATAGFGLVAALAWNSAIQDLFNLFFPNRESLLAKFLYAIVITVLIVLVTSRLGKVIAILKESI